MTRRRAAVKDGMEDSDEDEDDDTAKHMVACGEAPESPPAFSLNTGVFT